MAFIQIDNSSLFESYNSDLIGVNLNSRSNASPCHQVTPIEEQPTSNVAALYNGMLSAQSKFQHLTNVFFSCVNTVNVFPKSFLLFLFHNHIVSAFGGHVPTFASPNAPSPMPTLTPTNSSITTQEPKLTSTLVNTAYNLTSWEISFNNTINQTDSPTIDISDQKSGSDDLIYYLIAALIFSVLAIFTVYCCVSKNKKSASNGRDKETDLAEVVANSVVLGVVKKEKKETSGLDLKITQKGVDDNSVIGKEKRKNDGNERITPGHTEDEKNNKRGESTPSEGSSELYESVEEGNQNETAQTGSVTNSS